MKCSKHPASENQLALFPGVVDLVKVVPEARQFRFYRMVIAPDLFGGASLIREWGRIGQPGRVCSEGYADEGQAFNALASFTARKRRKGYREAAAR